MKTIRILKRTLKIALLLLVLIVFDTTCTNRDIGKMPPLSGERLRSLYSIYNPAAIRPAWRALKEAADKTFEENDKGEGVAAVQRFAAYMQSFDQIDRHQKLVLITPACLLVFAAACLLFARILKRTGLNIVLDENTRKGTVLKN